MIYSAVILVAFTFANMCAAQVGRCINVCVDEQCIGSNICQTGISKSSTARVAGTSSYMVGGDCYSFFENFNVATSPHCCSTRGYGWTSVNGADCSKFPAVYDR
ncbi:MAG: hypothetical protein J3R72DRAFT_456911 [Linnemannia gamsii]|nr:MAG: hypothetical protein J3R72DRAFT_456911 [Linnemannia gamsii]